MATRISSKWLKLSICGAICFVLVCLHQTSPVRSQFFTKATKDSKAIPRMGRRSDPRQDMLPGESQSQLSTMFDDSNYYHDNEDKINGYNNLDKVVGRTVLVSSKPTRYNANMPDPASLISDNYVSSGSKSDWNRNSRSLSSLEDNQIKSSEPTSWDRLAMRKLYLARLGHQFDSGQQILSLPKAMGISRLRDRSAAPSLLTMKQVAPDSPDTLASEDLIGVIRAPSSTN